MDTKKITRRNAKSKKEPKGNKHKHFCYICDKTTDAHTIEMHEPDGDLTLRTICAKCGGVEWWRRRLETREDYENRNIKAENAEKDLSKDVC